MVEQMKHVMTWGWVISILWLTGITASFLWPSSFWFEVHDIHVVDGKAGDPISMVVEREIKRDFEGAWSVSIRQINGSSTRLTCVVSSKLDYRKDAQLPTVLTIGWWTDGACKVLPVGQYVLTTTWYIYPKIGPTKTIRNVSNIFKVTE